MQQVAPEVASVVSIAEACLGGMRGRAALLVGSEKRLQPYRAQLYHEGILRVYSEDTAQNLAALLPRVQLLMHLPDAATRASFLTAAAIARGCAGRRAPLVILDLAETPSIEELAGLLPAVCLYTPDDLRRILASRQVLLA